MQSKKCSIKERKKGKQEVSEEGKQQGRKKERTGKSQNLFFILSSSYPDSYFAIVLMLKTEQVVRRRYETEGKVEHHYANYIRHPSCLKRLLYQRRMYEYRTRRPAAIQAGEVSLLLVFLSLFLSSTLLCCISTSNRKEGRKKDGSRFIYIVLRVSILDVVHSKSSALTLLLSVHTSAI